MWRRIEDFYLYFKANRYSRQSTFGGLSLLLPASISLCGMTSHLQRRKKEFHPRIIIRKTSKNCSLAKFTQSQRRSTLTDRKLTATQYKRQRPAFRTDAGSSMTATPKNWEETRITHGARAVSFCRQKTLWHSTEC